jgi:hypothetical protein
VEVLVQRNQPLLVHMGVNLGGGDVGMTEQLLDDTQVGSAFEQVGGEGVAKRMGV